MNFFFFIKLSFLLKVNFRQSAHFGLLIVFTISIFCMASCGKEAAHNKRKENIIGLWDISQTFKEFRSDTLYAEYTIQTAPIEAYFLKNGTGEFKTALHSFEFEWFYQYEPERILLVGEKLTGSDFYVNTFYHDIIENTKDYQLWRHEVDVPGKDTTYLYTWKMNRK